MDFNFERRNSVAARWSWRVAVFSAVLLVVAGAGHRYQFVETVPFAAVLALVGVLAVLALLLAVAGFVRLWQRGDKGGRSASKGVLLALLVLAPFGWVAYLAYSLPALNDVSTDPLNPPLYVLLAARAGDYVNPIAPISREQAERQLAAYPAVSGRRFVLPIDRALDITLAVLRDLNWKVAGKPSAEEGMDEVTVEAVAPSLIFGFLSDVAIRITDESDTTYVDIRSSARYGLHDLGGSAAKIERFYTAFDEEFAARSAPTVRADN